MLKSYAKSTSVPSMSQYIKHGDTISFLYIDNYPYDYGNDSTTFPNAFIVGKHVDSSGMAPREFMITNFTIK